MASGIGIVGPQESVAPRVLEVATSINLDVPVKARTYRHIEEAGDVARRVARSCDYILFTGQAAYAIARSSAEFPAQVDYVDYTATDIARALFVAANDIGRVIPPFSIDGFDADLIRTTCQDLGVSQPTQILTLSEYLFLDDASLERIVDSHRLLLLSGRATVTFTCLGGVAQTLWAERAPVYRVTHTYSSIRTALERARNWLELARSRETEIVVGSIQFPPGGPTDQDTGAIYVEQLAAEVRGTYAKEGDDRYRVHSTFGPFDDAMRPGEKGREALRQLQQAQAQAGFGTASSVAGAIDNADRARRLSGQRTGAVYLVRPDGSARHLLDGPTLSMREIGPEFRSAAKELGFGPLSLRRLVEALDRLDPDQVSVRDVANAYGVSPRTARRILASLRDHHLAFEVGVEMSPGPGRPQTLYQLDIESLVGLVEGTYSMKPSTAGQQGESNPLSVRSD